MPRKSLGPRLYLDPRRRQWVIRDGARFVRTGRCEGDNEQAAADLIRYQEDWQRAPGYIYFLTAVHPDYPIKGDYAPLDTPSKSSYEPAPTGRRYRWLRLAGLTLCCLIAFWCHNEQVIAGPAVATAYQETEGRSSPFSKGVSILDAAKDVQFHLMITDCRSSNIINNILQISGGLDFAVGTERCFATWMDLLDKLKASDFVLNKAFGEDLYLYFIGWGLAGIEKPDHSDQPLIINRPDLAFLSKYVGSQLPSCGSVGPRNEIARCDPQEDSRESQNNSENGKNLVVVLPDKSADAFTIGINRDLEAGDIFLKGTIGGILLFLLYAGLKR